MPRNPGVLLTHFDWEGGGGAACIVMQGPFTRRLFQLSLTFPRAAVLTRDIYGYILILGTILSL